MHINVILNTNKNTPLQCMRKEKNAVCWSSGGDCVELKSSPLPTATFSAPAPAFPKAPPLTGRLPMPAWW